MGSAILEPPEIVEVPSHLPESLILEEEVRGPLWGSHVALVTREDPLAPQTGRGVRVGSLGHALARAGARVTFFVPGGDPERAATRTEGHIRVTTVPEPPDWRNPIALYPSFNPPATLLAAAREAPDVVILSDSRCGPGALLLGALGVRVILDFPHIVEDVLRGLDPGSKDVLRIQPVERVAAREPEGILVASSLDAEVLVVRHAAHERRVVVFPNCAQNPPPRPRETVGDAVVWLGPVDTRPNRDAVLRIRRSIVPLLKRLAPGTDVILAGRGTELLGDDPGIQGLGSVDDLDAVFRRARCLLVPFKTTAGAQVKIMDALCRGVPVVATPSAVEGHEDFEEAGMFVERTDRDLAAQLDRLVRSPGRAAEAGARGARRYAELRDPTQLAAPVIDLVRRARRAWISPAVKLDALATLRGCWPTDPANVEEFLRSRPARFSRFSRFTTDFLRRRRAPEP